MSWHSIALVVSACAFLVVSQVLLKLCLGGADAQEHSMGRLLALLMRRGLFWLALGSVALGAVLWLAVLRATPVSVAYPVLSVSYVLMLPAAWVVFREPVTAGKITGVVIICLGIFIVARTTPP